MTIPAAVGAFVGFCPLSPMSLHRKALLAIARFTPRPLSQARRADTVLPR
jgi:hypothetical protein